MSAAATAPTPVAPAPRRKVRVRSVVAWAISVLALAGAGLVAFAVFRPTATAKTPTNLPLATAKRGEFLVTVVCRGELVAERSVFITAPSVPNLTIVWMAPPNSTVKAGDVVIRFDGSGAQRQLKEKQAALAQGQATLDQATAQAKITEEQDRIEIATLKQAVELARIEVSKAEILSALQGEENKIALALAEEKLKVKEAAARLNAASAASKIGSARSQRDKAQAEVELMQSRVAMTEIKTPAAGAINYMMNYSQGWMNAKPFKIGDSVWPGSTVAEIPDLSSLRLKGKAEEIDRGKMKVGQDVRVTLDPFPEKTFKGKLDRLSALTEQSFEWPPTRSFRAFSTLGEEDQRLRPQMNGRMDVIVDRLSDAISVPAKAVFARDGRPVVLVPSTEGVQATHVEVLARNADEVAIRGIAAGTQVALVDNPEGKKKAEAKQ